MLGYIVALANEGGGRIVLGMEDKAPHAVCGSDFAEGKVGELQSAIYKALGIRVQTVEYFENSKRVLVIEIPSRPVGRLLKFEGVALMRVGEELLEMSDARMFKILSEQEPDYSAKICDGLTIDDLDEKAVSIMKYRYAQKNGNPLFETLPDVQVLSDLGLMDNGKLNYAALVLVGKSSAIKKFLPQNNVVIEYRKDPASIQYDDREEFQLPLFIVIDEIWKYLNQPSSNPMVHINEGPYIFDIKKFNEDVVREAILNAVAHRSMQIQSDVVIKQSPELLTITNAGGFPLGVDLENILTVNSTPRSKTLTDVLQKTGLVERSGQGVDKMFTRCIMEAKHLPDYSGTDAYQVALTLRTEIRDTAFLAFIQKTQEERDVNHKLNILELLTLYKVFFGISEGEMLDIHIAEKLFVEGLLRKTKTGDFILSNGYSKKKGIEKGIEKGASSTHKCNFRRKGKERK